MPNGSRAPLLRTTAWVGVAVALHALLLASVWLVPVRPGNPEVAVAPPPAAAAAAAAEPEIVITLENEPREPAAPGPRAEPTPGAATSRPSAGAETHARARSTTAGEANAGAANTGGAATQGEGPPSSAPSGAPSGGVAIPIPFTSAELGIGGQNPFLPRAEEKAPVSGPDHPAARALRGTGRDRDRELGLGPEGPAIKALSEATASSIAPLRGRAVFVIRAGGDGVVSAVDIVDAEGGAGWLDAGRLALEALRGKKLALPRGATAMNIRIEVRSDMKLPNGENRPVDLRRGDNDMPEMTIPDISNIGAKPRRVVHARAVGTEVF